MDGITNVHSGFTGELRTCIIWHSLQSLGKLKGDKCISTLHLNLSKYNMLQTLKLLPKKLDIKGGFRVYLVRESLELLYLVSPVDKRRQKEKVSRGSSLFLATHNFFHTPRFLMSLNLYAHFTRFRMWSNAIKSQHAASQSDKKGSFLRHGLMRRVNREQQHCTDSLFLIRDENTKFQLWNMLWEWPFYPTTKKKVRYCGLKTLAFMVVDLSWL